MSRYTKMNIIIFSHFLLSFFIVQVTTAFQPIKWQENVKGFVDETVVILKNLSENDANCLNLGLQQLDQQKSEIFKKFSSCGRSQMCYYNEENIFHQRVEDIKAEIGLCNQHICTYIKDETIEIVDSKIPMSEEKKIEIVIDFAGNCSFLSWASTALDFEIESIKNWINGTVNEYCLKQIRPVVEKAIDDTIEGIRECKKIVVDSLKSTITKNYNWKNLWVGMQKMGNCSETEFMVLETVIERQTNAFHKCASLTNADYKYFRF